MFINIIYYGFHYKKKANDKTVFNKYDYNNTNMQISFYKFFSIQNQSNGFHIQLHDRTT